MRTNNLTLFFSLFAALLCMGTQCNKEIEYQYRFLEKADINPKQTLYHVTDTLWLEYSNTDNRLFNTNTNQRILADTTTLSLEFFYNANYKLSGDTMPAGGFCDFVIPVDMQAIDLSSKVYNRLRLESKCNRPIIKVGIVPKVKGAYSISFFLQNYVTACPNRISPFPLSLMEYRFMDNKQSYYVNVE